MRCFFRFVELSDAITEQLVADASANATFYFCVILKVMLYIIIFFFFLLESRSQIIATLYKSERAKGSRAEKNQFLKSMR